jgi:polyhydroxybutyrate depolymerase
VPVLLAVALVGAAVASAAIPAVPSVPPACTTAPAPGTSSLAITVDAVTRTALLHVPAGLAPRRPVPLVIALHGVGGSGPKMERYSGLSGVADRHRFIVAYPSSAGPSWNSTAASGLPDDVRFIGRLIGAVRSRQCVDPARVYLAGVSNGGGMAALAGCALAGQVAGIASVAGGYDGQPACHPARPLSVLEVHGTADPVVRTSAGRNGRPVTVCRVEHVRVLRGRHQWPGATPPDPGPPSTFCAACELWRFFAGIGGGARVW